MPMSDVQESGTRKLYQKMIPKNQNYRARRNKHDRWKQAEIDTIDADWFIAASNNW